MSDQKIAEFEPPQACVNRLIKAVLPPNVQITKDARAAFARAAGIFIFYLTHCSNDICHDRKRQTISRADVTAALRELDMESFIEPLDAYFEAVKNNAGKITSSSADVEIEADVDRDVGVDEEEEQEENEDPDEPVAKSRRLNEDGDVPVVGDGSYGLNQQEKE